MLQIRLFLGLILLLLSLGVSGQSGMKGLSRADRASIEELNEQFIHGWVNNDEKTVLSLFARDAILFPPGQSPVVGVNAIRGYWWPQDGSVTHITKFERSIDEIAGTRQLALLRGTSILAWTYEKNGKTSSSSSRSTDLVLLKRERNGRWRIVRQIWNTLPA